MTLKIMVLRRFILFYFILFLQREAIDSRSKPLPKLQPILEPFLLKPPFEERTITLKSGDTLSVRPPTTVKQLEDIHGLFRTSAERGEGIGLDEFTDSGLFCHRLLADVKILGVYTPGNGDLIGGCVFGKATIPRAAEKSLSGYIVITEEHRNRGIASEMLNMLERYTSEIGLEDLLFDVYVTDTIATRWLYSRGYIVTGTLPNSGFVKGPGFTDTQLWYKTLPQGKERHTCSFPFRQAKL